MKLKTVELTPKMRFVRVNALYEHLGEAAYDGNIGAQEVVQFYMNASDDEIAYFESELETGNESGAWDVVQQFNGVNLVGIGSDVSEPTTQREVKINNYINEYFNRGKEILTYKMLHEMVSDLLVEKAKPFVLDAKTNTQKKFIINFAGMGSAAECAEGGLLFGMLNRNILGGGMKVDKKYFKEVLRVQSGGAKKLKIDYLEKCIMIGAAIGNAGGVTKASAEGQKKEEEEDEESPTELNATPKTDIKIDGLRVSVKDSGAGYQAEAISENSFKVLFNYTFDKYKSDKANAKKEYMKVFSSKENEASQDDVVKLFQGVLADYRTNPDGHGKAMNTLFGLKGGKNLGAGTAGQEAKKEMGEDLVDELNVSIHNISLDAMTELFRDRDFKKEFIRQAITGEYKFGNVGHNSVASHILYFNTNTMTFQLRPIDEEYINEVVDKFTWQIRTGKRKAAPMHDDKAYGGETHGNRRSEVQEKLNAWLGDILKYVSSNVARKRPNDVDELRLVLMRNAKKTSGRGVFLVKKGEDGEPEYNINQFFYEFLRKVSGWTAGDVLTNAFPEGFKTMQEFYDTVWARFTDSEGWVDDDDFTGFKGRDGRFGTDVAPDKATHLPNTIAKEELQNLSEGWFGDAIGKIYDWGKGAVERAMAFLSASGSQVLDALGFSIGTQTLPHPEPKMDNTFKK